MYVCMYVCMYVSMHEHRRHQIYHQDFKFMYVCCILMYECMYVCMYCMCVSMNVHVLNVHVKIPVFMYVCM